MVSYIFQLLALYLVVYSAEAAIFTSSVQGNTGPVFELLKRHATAESRPFHEALRYRKRQDRAQSSLQLEDEAVASADHQTGIWDSSILNPYIVPAHLGNPPQPFRLLLDLAWDTLFVPAAGCQGDCDGFDPKLHFYASDSSTYALLDPYAELVYGTDRFFGELATDAFRIAGLEVTDQFFVNVNRANPLGFLSFYFGYDGVLGLAPRFDHPLTSTQLTLAPSPWSMMVNQSVLDHNLFALELPSGVMDIRDPDRRGEITFGGISERYASSDFINLPLSNYSDQVWAVEAQSLTWENETHPIHENFVNLTLAGFDTTSWFIGLPGHWYRDIYASIEHKCSSILCTVECDQRRQMPNLTFGIGGQNITLTPFDYVDEMLGMDDEKVCLFDVYPTDGQYPVNAIVLGKPFMETFFR